MRIETHALLSPSLATRREVVSFHFGPTDSGSKAYLQASLHADELPGMLVIHQLRGLLEQAEREGRVRGEIVLVPVANPIGLSQWLLYQNMGRFELATAQNFNRGFPDFLGLLGEQFERELGADPALNRKLIRNRIKGELDRHKPPSELDSLRFVLARLACDADVVLDLHCDEESILHLYTEEPYWEQAEPLARYLGAEVILLARGQGARSFDEAMSGVWWQLPERLGSERAMRHPIPLACFSATIEYRGQADVNPQLALEDAERLLAFLQHRGLVAGKPPLMPQLRREPTPLAGSEDVRAPHAGVICFCKEPGDWVEAGQMVAEVIDPLANLSTPVIATVAGVLYGRARERYATPHRVVCRIAGAREFRTGMLLSP
ncbi:MAG: succinylglutamate desuccinylase/aspartoacylase family protein [Burkholderiaceae bacterium]|jgi:predicted deacylase